MRHSDGFSASFGSRYSDGYFTDINNRPRGKTNPYVVPVRIFADGHFSDQASGTGRATAKWLKSGAADKIRKLVSAMIIVVPREHYDPTGFPGVEAVFGVPGGIFPGLDEAMLWLEQTDVQDIPSIASVRRIVQGHEILSG